MENVAKMIWRICIKDDKAHLWREGIPPDGDQHVKHFVSMDHRCKSILHRTKRLTTILYAHVHTWQVTAV